MPINEVTHFSLKRTAANCGVYPSFSTVSDVLILHGPSMVSLKEKLRFLQDRCSPWEIVVEDSQVLAVHAAALHSFEILYFGGDEHSFEQFNSGDIHNTRLYDIARNEVIPILSPPADVFCCGHAFTGEGRLLVAGGTENILGTHVDAHGMTLEHWSGARECAIYVESTRQWLPIASLQPQPGHASRGGGRWYPTLVTLSDGRILAIGGHPIRRPDQNDPMNDGRHGSWTPEVYTGFVNEHTLIDRWVYIFGEDLYLSVPEGPNYLYYPRVHVITHHNVFLVSPIDGKSRLYNPNDGQFVPIGGDDGAPRPSENIGFSERGHTSVLLPLLPGDDYQPRILFLGPSVASKISPSQASPSWEMVKRRDWFRDPPVRRHGCAIILPTGEIFFTGGISSFDDEDEFGVLNGEIYDPGIDWISNSYDSEREKWTTVEAARVVRNYHSVALLMPDGRVWSAGSNKNSRQTDPDNRFGTAEFRIEVYRPIYFGDPKRPSISSAPSTIRIGQGFNIYSPQASRIQRVALIRFGSVTHAFDADQRYVGLPFSKTASGRLRVDGPPGSGVAPPGAYMLWIIDDRGRPCHRAVSVIVDES